MENLTRSLSKYGLKKDTVVNLKTGKEVKAMPNGKFRLTTTKGNRKVYSLEDIKLFLPKKLEVIRNNSKQSKPKLKVGDKKFDSRLGLPLIYTEYKKGKFDWRVDKETKAKIKKENTNQKSA